MTNTSLLTEKYFLGKFVEKLTTNQRIFANMVWATLIALHLESFKANLAKQAQAAYHHWRATEKKSIQPITIDVRQNRNVSAFRAETMSDLEFTFMSIVHETAANISDISQKAIETFANKIEAAVQDGKLDATQAQIAQKAVQQTFSNQGTAQIMRKAIIYSVDPSAPSLEALYEERPNLSQKAKARLAKQHADLVEAEHKDINEKFASGMKFHENWELEKTIATIAKEEEQVDIYSDEFSDQFDPIFELFSIVFTNHALEVTNCVSNGRTKASAHTNDADLLSRFDYRVIRSLETGSFTNDNSNKEINGYSWHEYPAMFATDSSTMRPQPGVSHREDDEEKKRATFQNYSNN
jgi:hypothetical protein